MSTTTTPTVTVTISREVALVVIHRLEYEIPISELTFAEVQLLNALRKALKGG